MTLSRIRTLSLGQLGIMGTLSFSRQRLQFDSNAEFSSTECLERYTDNERDYVMKLKDQDYLKNDALSKQNLERNWNGIKIAINVGLTCFR